MRQNVSPLHQRGLHHTFLFAFKLTALSILVMMGVSILKPRPAAAFDPRGIPNDIKAAINAYEGRCAGMAEKYFLVDWISPRGDTANRGPVKVYPGTQVVPLQINYLIFVCHDRTNYSYGTWGPLGAAGLPDDLQTPNASMSTDYRWKSNSWAAPDGIVNPNLIGDAYNVATNKDPNSRYWYSTQWFDYIAPAPMFRSKNISINFTVHEWLTYHNNWGDTWCATSGGTQHIAGGAAPFGCPGHNISYPIFIEMTNWGALGVLDAIDCPRGFQGWALDMDSPGTEIAIHIYADAPAGAPGAKIVGGYVANQPRPDVNAALKVPGNHGFVIPPASIPAQFRTGPRTFYLYAIGVDRGGRIDNLNPLIALRSTNFVVCTTTSFKLTPVAQTPTTPDEENPTTITFTSYVNGTTATPVQATSTRSITYQKGGVGPYLPLVPAINDSRKFENGQNPKPSGIYTDVITAAPPGGWQAGDRYCISLRVAPAEGTVDGSGNPVTITRASADTAPVCATVASKPYVSFFGNDITAGSRFNCSGPVSSAKIMAYNRGGAGSPGAGNQLGVFAVGPITEFASAALRTNAPMPPTGLTFANSPSSAWGGNFGVANCLPDYFASATSPKPTGYRVSGAGTRNIVSSEVEYVNGDALIENNVIYTNAGSWAAQNQVTSYYLIVKGNIYVAPGVDRLDGVYIAQPDTANPTNTGKIYTCANTATRLPVGLSSLYTTCNKQLTVNGTFIASQVKFLRTFGSLRDSVTAPGKPAEVFRFSPETYLAPGPLPAGTASVKKYDYITALPPVL